MKMIEISNIGVITLTHGFYTLIDIEDMAKVSEYKWHYSKGHSPRSKSRKRNTVLSRLIMGVEDTKILVDHISRDTLDNRKSNLRLATKSTNAMNSKVRSDNKHGVKGIWYDKKRELWEVYITLNQKRKHLGRFKTKRKATVARKQAEIKYFKEFRP